MSADKKRLLFLLLCSQALAGCGHFTGHSAFLWPVIDEWAMSQAAGAVAPTDYVAWYRFSGNYNDSSGHGLNLNASSNAPVGTTDRDMTLGNAYSFNAAQTNYLSLSTNSLNFASDASFSYWVKIANFVADAHHICKASTSYGYCLGHTSGGNLRVDFWDANTDDNYFNTVALTAATWTHIAVTVKSRTGGRTRIYKNGTLQVDLPWPDAHTLGVTANPFYIGATSCGTADFTGAMDDIRIYGRELTAGEVSALYSLPAD